ncbi:hypothetical protein Taro_010991, partial [Colocasia esculenta]|nr:hypothetical protein [Colocasia esculenta]
MRGRGDEKAPIVGDTLAVVDVPECWRGPGRHLLSHQAPWMKNIAWLDEENRWKCGRMGTNTFCKRSVDTLHNGVDTITQIQRQKDEQMLRLCRHMSKSVSTRVSYSGNQTTQVDTLSGQVDTRACSQNSNFQNWGQQVDATPEQVDTGSCSQNSYFQNWDGRTTQYQSRLTLDQFPEQLVSRFGTVCH